MLEVGSVYKLSVPGCMFPLIPYNQGGYYMEMGTIVTVLSCELLLNLNTSIKPEWQIKVLIGDKILTLVATRQMMSGFIKIC